MSRQNPRIRRVLALAMTASACADDAADDAPERRADESCAVAEVREVVERLGERMARVPLLAPDSIVAHAIGDEYAALVTPELLGDWLAQPSRAPGREVSSPWPARIEIRSVSPDETRACRVRGEIVYVTSTDSAHTGATGRVPVTLQVVEDDGWRINTFDTGSQDLSRADSTTASADLTDAADAADVIRRYYAAINARDFRGAWESWGDAGAASGQTYDDFATGFAATESVAVEIGEPGRVEPAAGSRYIEIPVAIRAVTTTGDTERFEGSYTLRRSVIEGASTVARRWHIYSADIARIR